MGLARLLHRFLVRQTMPGPAVAYYNRMIDAVADFYLAPFCDEIAEAFPPPARILDVGTGVGQLPLMLARKGAGYRVTGTDLSEACLRAARAKVGREGLCEQVDFIRADLLKDAPFQERFDLVVSTCSLHHWRHPVRMLRAIKGLLKDKGRVWLMDDSGDASNETRRAWVERVERASGAGLLFRSVFRFESRFLAYTEEDVEQLCRESGLNMMKFYTQDVFFIVRLG